MKTFILNGVNSSGQISGSPNIRTTIKSVQFDLPLNERSTALSSLTLSGINTGAYTFHDDTHLELRFGYNEDIDISTSNFSGEYSAIVSYVQAGDMRSYMQNDKSRSVHSSYPNFWRYK